MSVNAEFSGGHPELGPKDEIRLQNLVNSAGFPINDAYKAITGIDLDSDQSRAPISRQTSLLDSHSINASRRGGRSYPEPSDSALDPYWNRQFEPLSDGELAAQRETNRQGRRLADQVLSGAEAERTRRDAERWGVPFEALLRARNARRGSRNV